MQMNLNFVKKKKKKLNADSCGTLNHNLIFHELGWLPADLNWKPTQESLKKKKKEKKSTVAV